MPSGCARPAVEFMKFSFTYRGSAVPALRDIDLCLEAGELHLIVGGSGSGKTSLIRSIIGLIPHFYEGDVEGDVRVMGESVAGSSIGDLAKRVGYVFQDPENQLLAATVGRDVSMSLEAGGTPPDIAEGISRGILRRLGVDHLFDKSPHELSDGQRQRVAIAGEIARAPRILLLDEPSSMLDPRATAELMVMLKELKMREGLTMIVVEHRLEPAIALADNVVALRDGGVMLSGAPRDLLGDWMSVAELKSAGVSTPPVVQIYHSLKHRGIDIARVPLSVDELLSEVRA